jgi:hypothetical protein
MHLSIPAASWASGPDGVVALWISGRADLRRAVSDRLGEFGERRGDPQCGPESTPDAVEFDVGLVGEPVVAR